MFRIWKERRVYSNVFLKELELLIEPAKKTQVNEPLPDFKVIIEVVWCSCSCDVVFMCNSSCHYFKMHSLNLPSSRLN